MANPLGQKSDISSRVIWFWTWRSGAVLLALTIASMAGCPVYNVWSAKMDGEAALAHANQSRQIIVTQANAELEAARARSQAIEIVGKMAKEYPEYRQQEFIGAFAEALKDGKINQIIYVPTETNIPIMEAARHAPAAKKE